MGFVKEDTIDNFRAHPGIEFLGETLSDQPSVSVGMGEVCLKASTLAEE